MFSVSRNERRRRVGARVAADRESATGIGDNSAEISDNSAGIGDGAAGIVDIAANMIPSLTPSWMETGVTLFLEDKFQRGHWMAHLSLIVVYIEFAWNNALFNWN